MTIKARPNGFDGSAAEAWTHRETGLAERALASGFPSAGNWLFRVVPRQV